MIILIWIAFDLTNENTNGFQIAYIYLFLSIDISNDEVFWGENIDGRGELRVVPLAIGWISQTASMNCNAWH